MDLALVCARVLLASVFAVAGLAKLVDQAGSRQSPVDFGVPPGLAAPLARCLPLIELAVAIAVLPRGTAWWGAVGSLALVLLFVAAIGLNLARGRAPRCRCFGQLTAGPVGRSTIVRNLGLGAVAGFVVWQGRLDPGPSLVAWIGYLTTAERVTVTFGLAGTGLLIATVLLLVQILGQQGRLLLRLDELERRLPAGGGHGLAGAAAEGLPIEAPAPDFQLRDLDGEERTLDSLLTAGRPLLLLFTDPACGPCSVLLPDVGRWQRELADHLVISVISRGEVGVNRAGAAEHGVTAVLLQRDFEVADAYRVHGTPSALLVLPDGTIGSPVASGPEQIHSLVAHTLAVSGAQPWADLLPLPMADGHAHRHDHPHPRV